LLSDSEPGIRQRFRAAERSTQPNRFIASLPKAAIGRWCQDCRHPFHPLNILFRDIAVCH
jgi:hypothetical protein